jgi:ABC-2 type transport system ATP-binding protein
MKSDTIIEASDLTLVYRRTRHRISSLKQTAIDTIGRRISYENFYALNSVSLEVARGETLAVIGRNGAGKSTLLKILARVLPPSSGRVVVRGAVAPMIELGAGFNPELTGSENIMLYGTLLGRDSKTVRSRIEAIADWAQLTDHLDVPLRAYSSGMVARLAFSIATDVTPDLLLIDEVLSVGDENFQLKSKKRTEELMKGGCAVVLVTHDLHVVQNLASRALYLENGAERASGSPESVIGCYQADLEIQQ